MIGNLTPQDAAIAAQIEKLDESAREFFEERAGILEFDAGYPRKQAERLAWNETLNYLNQRKNQ